MRKITLVTLFLVIGIGGYATWMAEQPVQIDPASDWEATITSDAFSVRSFMVPVDGAEIEAMILLPNDRASPSGAVVFTGGSGDGLFQNYRKAFLKTYLQDVFLPRNIAVVYANKRGMGASTGNWKNNTIEGRAADVIAVANAVRAKPEIDPGKVGYAGHSQGGWVVVRAAAEDPKTAFVLDFMGPLRTPWEQFENMWRNVYVCDGKSPDQVEAALERKRMITNVGRSIGQYAPIGQLEFDAAFFDYETEGLLARVSAPLLSVYGSHDFLVDGPASSAFLASEFPTGAPEHLEVMTFEGLNHGGFHTASLCAETFNSTTTEVSPDLQEAIGDWLTRIGAEWREIKSEATSQ